MKKKAEKVTQAEDLKKQLATVSTVILSTFQGITVEQDTQLRRSVEAAGGKYQVVKNTVAERAGAGRGGLHDFTRSKIDVCFDRSGRHAGDSQRHSAAVVLLPE